MCITEEEFRIERKRAMEVLEQFKERERTSDMVTVRIDAKTVKSVRREDRDAHRSPRRTKKRRAAQDGFFDFSLEEFFQDFDCGEADVFYD